MNKRILAFITGFMTFCVILVIGYMSGQNITTVAYYMAAITFMFIGCAATLYLWIQADEENEL